MACQPPHPESLAALRHLREECGRRGEECLALLLGGVELYVTLGREWELLEVMRNFAHDAHEMVHNTPTARDLEQLYQREDPPRQ